jgi:hypothetical protein
MRKVTKMHAVVQSNLHVIFYYNVDFVNIFWAQGRENWALTEDKLHLAPLRWWMLLMIGKVLLPLTS